MFNVNDPSDSIVSIRELDEGKNSFELISKSGLKFFCDKDNILFKRELEKGLVPVTTYVAPPAPTPLTAKEKLERSGLSVDELKTLLGI